MMSVLFIVFFLFCFLHWAYQSIVAPTNNLLLQSKLYSIERQALLLSDRPLSEADMNILSVVKQMAGAMRQCLKELDAGAFFVLWSARNEHAKEMAEAKSIIQKVNDCNNPSIRQLHGNSIIVVSLAVASNSLPLILYFSPLMIIGLIIALVRGDLERQIQAAAIHLRKKKII